MRSAVTTWRSASPGKRPISRPTQPIQLTVFPREEGPVQFLYDRLTGKEREDDTLGLGSLGRAIEAAQPLLQRIEAALDGPGVLTMPPIAQPR